MGTEAVFAYSRTAAIDGQRVFRGFGIGRSGSLSNADSQSFHFGGRDGSLMIDCLNRRFDAGHLPLVYIEVFVDRLGGAFGNCTYRENLIER